MKRPYRIRRAAMGFHPDHFNPGWGDGSFHPPMDGGIRGGGGGGGLPETSPLTIFGSKLAVWHRTNQGYVLVGSNVDTWADLSGNGRHLTQATDANQFIFEPNGINGWPLFNAGTGGTRFMDYTSWPQVSACTVYAVVKWGTHSSVQVGVDNGTGGGSAYPLPAFAVSINKPELFVSTGGAATWGTALTDGVNYLVRWAWNYVGAAADIYVQVNGAAEVASTTTNETLSSWTRLGHATASMRGKYAEVFIVNDLATANENAAVRAYVTARYGIAM